jgi:hypothetical protein
MENSRDLRRLAELYRAFAEVEHSDEREGRSKIAEYLDHKAVQLDEREEFHPAGGVLRSLGLSFQYAHEARKV